MIQKFGKYAIVEKLGEGAMGAVYKAYDEILDRYVAIKTMAEDIKWDPELKLRFYREARSAAGLHHPNIVTIHDLGEEGKITYIVMELLQGRDLKDLIKERTPLSIEKRISIMAQVCDGLSHAHLAGIIHRDIKPGNIHFSTTGTVKIVDFGIARIPSSDLTRSGVRLGTPIYMSPEQIKGENYDERSDMFSAGLVFYELLTFVHPFRDKNIAKTVDNILFQNHFSFEEQCPEAPPGLWPILRTALEKEAAKRYPGMADMGRACRGLLAEMSAAAQKMTEQVNRALPGLRQAASRPDAPPIVITLLQQAQSLLAQSEPPDLASLRLMAAALAEYAQQAPQQSGAAGPPVPPPPAPPSPQQVRGMELLQSGQALLKEERLDEAGQALLQAAGLLGNNAEALAALAEVNRKIAERTNSRCAALLDEARRSMESRQYQAAIESLNQVLQLVPDHPEAAELRRRALAEVESERRAAARKDQGEREKAAGMKLLQEKKYRDSAAALARAAELLEGDAGVREALQEATRQAEAEELRLAVETGLRQAGEALRAGALDQARTYAQNVLKLSPENAEAIDILSRIGQAEEQQRKARAFADFLSRSRNHLRHGEFDQACEALDKARELDPANPEIEKVSRAIINARTEKEKRDRVDAALARGREALTREDFEEATAACNEALEIDAGTGAGRSLLDAIRAAQEQKRRNEQIAQLCTNAEQAFSRSELDVAEKYAREALAQDPACLNARGLLQRIGEARERRKREEIDALLAQCRRQMEQGNLEEAGKQAEAVLALEPQNKAAASLAKDIKREIRNREKALADEARQKEKEARRQEKEAQYRQQKEARQQEQEARRQEKEAGRQQKQAPPPRDGEGTLVLAEPPGRGFPKALLWIGAVAIFAGLVAIAVWQLPKILRPADPAARLAAAQSLLDKGLLDEAIQAAQQVLDAAPENAQARTLLENARKQKTAKEASLLLMEAQALRSSGKLQESLDTITKLLSLDPSNEPALSVRAQVESEMAASKSAAEQNVSIQGWLANANSLIAAGRPVEAKAELDKVARIRPDHPDLAPLRKKLATRTDLALQLEKDRAEQAQKQKRIDGLSAQADAHFKQGKYAEARAVIDQWIALAPQNPAAQALLNQTSQAMQHLRAFESALAEKTYDEALKAVAQLEKVNPADPAIAEMRQRAEGHKASARAVISIYRLGFPGVIAIDDEVVGNESELENRPVPIGRHKISVTINGKQISRTADFQDGQREAYVYDHAAMELRPMVEADRALIARRKALEQVNRYDVEHRHLLGKCTGILSISGLKVSYQASEKSHSFDRPLTGLKITVRDKDDKVEIQTADGKQSWSFKARDAAQAAEIREHWTRLLKLLK
jgi:tetratricopeptide (TPR) repeat protein/tRNA A-37 threonylcarbamoyl transferase component Bud32